MGDDAVRAFLKWLTRAEVLVAGTAFIAITLLIFADVVARELVGNGIYGAQRVAVYCMAVAAFIGFAVTTQLGGHIRIDGLDRLVPKRFDPGVNRLADLVSCGLCLFLAYWAWRFVSTSFEMGERGVALDFAVWPIQSAMIWMFASGALRYALFFAFPAARPAPPEIGS